MKGRTSTAGALLGVDRAGARAAVAVVGCGGKTSWIESVARTLSTRKVLVSPTTKIRPMTGVPLCVTMEECRVHRPAAGTQCFGLLDRETGKLGALPLSVLSALAGEYDVLLLEADGSRGLPCKGWLETEPVVPAFCTHTVGIVTLGALGKPADARSVLRLPAFSRLTGLREGEPITEGALADMICAPGGMLKNAAGLRSVFVNQAEDEASAAEARRFLLQLDARCPGRFSVLAYGSARENSWTEV